MIYDIITGLKESYILYFQSLSRGTHSYEVLALLNHPYAERHGGKLAKLQYNRDPRYINKHTGLFESSWNYKDSSNGFKIVNTAPYANLLFDGIQGLTVPRPTMASPKSIEEVEKITKIQLNLFVKSIVEEFKTLGDK